MGFPCGSAGKEFACNVGDLGSIPGLGRSPGEGKGYPLQYSGLENFMDCVVHGVTKSQTRLSDFQFLSLLCVLWKDGGGERIPTPVFWPGELHGLCSPWGHKESDATFTFKVIIIFVTFELGDFIWICVLVAHSVECFFKNFY